MLSPVHAATDAIIASSIANPIGLVVALGSHFSLDLFGEKGFKSRTKTIVVDMTMLTICLMIVHDNFWGVAGLACAILPDVIDKSRAWIFGLDQVFWCHEPDYPILIQFNVWQTQAINVISIVALWLII